MLCAVRGMIVTDDAIRMYAFGGRCRHGQDLCGAYAEGGDGAIVPVTIRRGKCSRSLFACSSKPLTKRLQTALRALAP